MTPRPPRTERLSDEALLSGLAIGDGDATLAFVRRFESRVFGVAMAVVHDVGVAEDVSQQAFERAWRHGRTYDPRKGSVSAWLLAITRNVAIDQFRARRPVGPIRLEDVLDLADPGAGPEERALSGAALRRLRLALATLPDEQARALVLAALEGRTRSEIADLEQVPEGTVKTRIRAAVRKLRSALDERVLEP